MSPGKYKFSFIPNEASTNTAVEMTIPEGMAVLEMAAIFQQFLMANGYPLDWNDRFEILGEEDVIIHRPELERLTNLENTPKETLQQFPDFWENDGFSLVGNPFPGSSSEDTLFFSEQYWRNRDFFAEAVTDTIRLG